jgi:microcystin-dependent protein
MADAYTPSLALIQPEVGASRDTWGTKWNQNATIIDQFVSQFCVVGMIADFAGPTAPSGWLICDGRTVSRTTYSKLFAVIGVYWGSGDGSTTFRLPNTAGRSLLAPGTVTDQGGLAYAFGFTQMQGFVYSPITQNNLPAYNLVTDSQGYHSHGGGTQAAGSHAHTTDAQGVHSHGGSYLPDHSHTGYTDIQGDHSHTYTRANEGVGVTGGGAVVASGANFGFSNYNTSVNGAHQHNVQTYGAGNIGLAIYGDGNHAHNVYAVGDHAHNIWPDGAHQHNVNLGGGGVPLNVLNPFLVVTKIIYAGQEAAIVTAADIAPAPASTDTHTEIEALREEIAALRALFETPRARMLSAPSRGPH